MTDTPETRQTPWRPTSPPLDPDSFEYAIEAPLTIVHFWAPWNPYDKPLDANLQQLQPVHAKRFAFFSVNTDETVFSEIVERHHVAALPTLLCFSNGKMKGRFHGLQTVEELKTFLDEMAQPQRR